MYALTFMINYTGARTLSRVYHYDALMIGVITITYGLGMLSGFPQDLCSLLPNQR
jgi:hypothetical protein